MDKESPLQTDPYFASPLCQSKANRREFPANKVLWAVFFLLIAGSVAFTYYRIMVKKDYLISSQVDCDPYAEKCFIWNCDPESTVEGEACTGEMETDVWYYKIVKRNASRIPLCDPETDEECQPFLCDPEEPECGETLCDEETAAEGEICTDPEEYALNNPMEEEELECDPEIDEECEAVECDPETDEECEETECDPEVDAECPAEEAVEETEGTTENTTEDAAEEGLGTEE